MFGGWTRIIPEISIFHNAKSPPSNKARKLARKQATLLICMPQALTLLRSALSAPYPPGTSSKPLEFKLDVVEGAPTSDQLKTILSFLPTKTDVPAASVFLSAHPSSTSSTHADLSEVSKLGRDVPDALKWPVVVDWKAGKASIGDVNGVTSILEEIRRARDKDA
ncbi:unnamed protein product [Mycena citricolor]|uniref:Thioredoxin-like protein n=1 Tax=Mycena citricolor TaxID=2018698 RepID=A0AAD2HR49_9AGAR|nr:unnamed protein product [Mycena citricolor]